MPQLCFATCTAPSEADGIAVDDTLLGVAVDRILAGACARIAADAVAARRTPRIAATTTLMLGPSTAGRLSMPVMQCDGPVDGRVVPRQRSPPVRGRAPSGSVS